MISRIKKKNGKGNDADKPEKKKKKSLDQQLKAAEALQEAMSGRECLASPPEILALPRFFNLTIYSLSVFQALQLVGLRHDCHIHMRPALLELLVRWCVTMLKSSRRQLRNKESSRKGKRKRGSKDNELQKR